MTGTAVDPEIDTTVWRVAGAPLVGATAPGPLTGQTVAVKDLYAVAGFPVGAGVPAYQEEQAPAPRHAAVVARLLSAGAQVAGIAHTDEFAYSLTGGNGGFGMPVNPAAPDRIPGGSTSGPAVAVARGEVGIGLGTDTAGSIRVPAAYQGLWGIRTTHGRVDTSGLLPLAQSFDSVGWVARDGATLAAVADCVLDGDSAASRGFVVDPAICAYADPSIAAAVRALAVGLGATPVEVAPADTWLAAFRTVQAFEAWANHGDWVAAHPGVLEPDVAERFAFAATVTGAQAAAARRVLDEAAETLRAALAGRALVLPTTATPAPPRSAGRPVWEAVRARTLRLTCLASIAGLPAVTMPLHPVATMPPGRGATMPPGPGATLPPRPGTETPPRPGAAPAGWCLLGAPGADRSLIRLALSTAAVLAEGSPHSEDRP
ncbi:amidase family protein [Nocardia sp. NBC_00416]|uniref:amidase family protein n=1 Tax=Nocardia sp. NBC_00416 TaxID=2975991 RepID=UPI002E250BB2